MRHRPVGGPRTVVDRRRFVRIATAWLAAAPLLARALDAPAGPVVLSIGGRIRHRNAGDRAVFDMAMLAALPQTTITTRTPWFPQPRRFTGPLLRDLLALVGASGTTIRLSALNDYRVDMPFEDALRHDVVVARLLDGQPMAVRDKGPLFVIYPFDDNPELRGAVYYSRSAWQLRTIEIL